MGVLQELSAEHVGQSVILLVHGEDGAVGSACERMLGIVASEGMQ